MIEAGTWIMNNVLSPVGSAFQALWFDVILPLFDNISAWVNGSIPWLAKFADTCTSIFRLKYNIRVAGFTITAAMFILLLPTAFIRRRRRRHRRR